MELGGTLCESLQAVPSTEVDSVPPEVGALVVHSVHKLSYVPSADFVHSFVLRI